MASLSGLASALESYRGRDRLIRTLGYCCQLVGGVLVEQCPASSELGTRLLAVSTQLSHCRTVLRLFDDLAMFVYTKQYGLGAEDRPEAHPPPGPAGGGRLCALDVCAGQPGRPTLLPLRARGLGRRRQHPPRGLLPVVDAEHNLLGPLPAPGGGQVPAGDAEAVADAAEPRGGLHQPAAAEQAEGRGDADAAGGADAAQQPGRPGQRRALAAAGRPVGRPLPAVAGGPPGHRLLAAQRVPGGPGRRRHPLTPTEGRFPQSRGHQGRGPCEPPQGPVWAHWGGRLSVPLGRTPVS
ncbi:peroxisomal membrane protein 11C isoform X1 [Microcebus murinus]|uniref:peroxisomal membrane protein 11C isoform X1 n=1 Tax=Microcebus murinus TaxID=30608 RepID=UPI003F6CB782